MAKLFSRSRSGDALSVAKAKRFVIRCMLFVGTLTVLIGVVGVMDYFQNGRSDVLGIIALSFSAAGAFLCFQNVEELRNCNSLIDKLYLLSDLKRY